MFFLNYFLINDMIILLLKSALFSFIFLVPLMVQPLRLGLIVIFISIILSGLLGMVFVSWFGFLLFLIYVGGLLVIFAYVIILIPNSYYFSKNIFIYGLLTFFLFFGLFLIIGFYLSLEESLISFQDSAQLIVSDYSALVFLFLSLVLFFALLVVVKVCHFHGGPLRPFSIFN